MKSEQLTMTDGPIYSKIIKFALPIFWGNVFQQLYNIVDSLVVGNFVGRDALAAISSTSALIMLMVGFFNGVFTGAGVVISKYYGSGDEKSVSETAHTSIAFGLISGVALTILGIVFTPQILKLMDTPSDVFMGAGLYLRIYFSGGLFIVLFNTISGIFQSVGDSKHPLYYLIISSVLNVVLDLLFVAVFKWGITGAGLATVVAMFVSVIPGIYRLLKSDGPHRLYLKKIKISASKLREIVKMGLPSGIQNSVISIANVVVQSNINKFGSLAMAGCGAYARLEGFVFIPNASISMAMTTFISQNLGARKYDRAKKGAKFGIIACAAIAELIGVILIVTAPFFISLFNNDPEVIKFGVMQSRIIAPFFALAAFSHATAGVLRGAGKSIVPMAVMLSCWCVFRVLYLTVITYFIKEIQVVFWAYPITWAISSVILMFYLIKGNWIYGLER